MSSKSANGDERVRQMLAQEAARIIVEQGIRDYRSAKLKAAERLGFHTRGALPGNTEIEQAVSEHLSLFGGDEHADRLHAMRLVAVSAMQLLAAFSPRLVGSVLAGTADENSAINLHVFADSAEEVALFLGDRQIVCKLYERRLKPRPGRHTGAETFAGYEFRYAGLPIEATVFPVDGIRQAPISPITGRPTLRADEKGVRALLEKGL